MSTSFGIRVEIQGSKIQAESGKEEYLLSRKLRLLEPSNMALFLAQTAGKELPSSTASAREASRNCDECAVLSGELCKQSSGKFLFLFAALGFSKSCKRRATKKSEVTLGLF